MRNCANPAAPFDFPEVTLNHNFYSVEDATLLAKRRHMKDVIELSGAADEFVLRGRSDHGKGIQELHLDFETEDYNFWVTFRRSGTVVFHRDARNRYERKKFYCYEMPSWTYIRDILGVQYPGKVLKSIAN